MMTAKSKARVWWTDEEKTELIKRAANIIYKNTGLSTLEALRRAQEQALPKERQRPINTLTAIPWYKPALDKQVEEHKKAVITEHVKIVEEIISIPMQLSEVKTDDLIAELLKRIFTAGGSGIVGLISNSMVQALREELPAAITRLQKQTKVATQTRQKKILILGLLPEQTNEIQKALGSAFDFTFWKDANPDSLKQTAPHQDKIYIMKRFIGHTHQELLNSVGATYTIVPGSTSELLHVLEKYFFEVTT